MCSSLDVQVSFSGQAVVFVVRTIKWSPMAVAGRLTYIAFFGAQVCARTRAQCAVLHLGVNLCMLMAPAEGPVNFLVYAAGCSNHHRFLRLRRISLPSRARLTLPVVQLLFWWPSVCMDGKEGKRSVLCSAVVFIV